MEYKQGWANIGWVVLSLVLGVSLTVRVMASSAEKADVRVLIDISGSMKKNDPRNLRRSALRLLVGLLPRDSRAGVWTFGQYVNMEIPLAKVDDAWKERARSGAERIHSRGLFTNIEGVLRRASEDWREHSRGYRRNMILLTDGMVDISKDVAANTAARQRILEQVVPRLQALGVKVHTIALSQRADHELMRHIAESTGGWYEQVDNAERLQRVFLHLFEKVGRPDALPIKDNRFTVDESIREMTLLVFRPEGAQPTRVQTPAGETFDAGTVPGSVSWHRDEGYDLLTVSHPEPGEWQVQAQGDPDNRVIVVTDLHMHVTELPNRVMLGQRLPVTASFTDKGGPLKRKAFFQILQLSSEQRNGKNISESQPLRDDGAAPDPTAGDGNFTQLIGATFAAGKTEFVITAKGKTFMRERRQSFEVVSPLVLDVSSGAADPVAEISLRPVAGMIDPDSVRVTAELADADGSGRSLVLQRGQDDVWTASLDLEGLEGAHALQVAVSGTTADGQQLDIALDPVAVQGRARPAPAGEEPMQTDAVESGKPVREPSPVKQVKAADWPFYAIVGGTAGLVLVLFGSMAFWFVRRRRGALEISPPREPEIEGEGSELQALREEIRHLSEELGVAMDTMGRMLSEYSNLFEGGAGAARGGPGISEPDTAPAAPEPTGPQVEDSAAEQDIEPSDTTTESVEALFQDAAQLPDTGAETAEMQVPADATDRQGADASGGEVSAKGVTGQDGEDASDSLEELVLDAEEPFSDPDSGKIQTG